MKPTNGCGSIPPMEMPIDGSCMDPINKLNEEICEKDDQIVKMLNEILDLKNKIKTMQGTRRSSLPRGDKTEKERNEEAEAAAVKNLRKRRRI